MRSFDGWDTRASLPFTIVGMNATAEIPEKTDHKCNTPNAGKPWPQAEQDKLADKFNSGMKLSVTDKRPSSGLSRTVCAGGLSGAKVKVAFMNWQFYNF